MSLYVQVTGDGPDIVLLHGWAMHGGVFASLLADLEQHYRVHCIDLPGHGRSVDEPVAQSIEQLTICILPHIPPHAVVLGWSLGGMVALQLAQQLPLRALVLVSTTPCFVARSDWPHGMPHEVFAQFFNRLQQNVSRTVQDFLSLQVRGDVHAASTLAALKNSLLQYPATPLALQGGLEILRDTDQCYALPTIAVPTLVLAGEHDRIAHPDASRYLAAHLQQAQFELIQRAGHAPFLSHHDEFILSVRSFLSSLANIASAHGCA